MVEVCVRRTSERIRLILGMDRRLAANIGIAVLVAVLLVLVAAPIRKPNPGNDSTKTSPPRAQLR